MTPEEAQHRLTARPPRRLAVLQTAFLGDVVFTSPLVRALKRRFPGSRLTLIVAPRGEAIARHMPASTRCWSTTSAGRTNRSAPSGAWGARCRRTCWWCRIPRSAALALVSRTGLTVGPGTFPQSLAHNVAVPPVTDAFVERMLALAGAVGATATPDLHLTVSDAELGRAREQLGRVGS